MATAKADSATSPVAAKAGVTDTKLVGDAMGGGATSPVASVIAAPITGPINAMKGAVGVASQFSDPSFWIRVTFIVVGLVLVIIGVSKLTGTAPTAIIAPTTPPSPSPQGPPPITRARRSATRAAETAAAA